MDFNKLKTEIKNVELDMTRSDNEDYFEAVIKTARLEELARVLESNFGPPAWPSRLKLLQEAQNALKNFGGIRKGQTLYFSNNGAHQIFAMLWPWQDNERVTIKAGKVDHPLIKSARSIGTSFGDRK